MIKSILSFVILLISFTGLRAQTTELRQITVIGQSVVHSPVDEIIAYITLSVLDDLPAESFADLERKQTMTMEFLKSIGVQSEKIEVSNRSVVNSIDYTQGNNYKGDLTLTATVAFSQANVDKLREFYIKTVKENISITLVLSRSEKSLKEQEHLVYQKSLADAKQKAERLAASQNVKLGKLMSITQYTSAYGTDYYNASLTYSSYAGQPMGFYIVNSTSNTSASEQLTVSWAIE
jgi:uncharacterized protein